MEKIIYGVDYFPQRDNKNDPYRTCYSTSMAMVMNYLLKKQGKTKADVMCPSAVQLEDFIYKYIYSDETKNHIKQNINAIGRWILPYFDNSLQLTAVAECYVFNKLMNEYGYKAEYKENVSGIQLYEMLRNDIPQVLHGNYSSTSKVKGHVVLCIGMDSKGVIVHDPYGDAKTGYNKTNGDAITYSFSEKYYDDKKYRITKISKV